MSTEPTPAPPPLSTPSPRTLGDIMSRTLTRVPPDTPLADAAQLMAQHRVSSVLVEDAGLPVGILTERDLLRLLTSGTEGNTPVSWVMSTPLTTARATDDYNSAWVHMSARHLRHLVVVDEAGQAQGLVSETDFRNHLDNALLRQMGGLSELMERDLPELPPTATVSDALQLMLSQRSTYVLVTHERRAVGILTERDVPGLLARRKGPGLDPRPLGDVVGAAVHTVPQHTWLVEAAALMQRLNLRHLVVVDEQGLVVGMVQMHDLMQRLGEHLRGQQRRLEKQHLQARTRSAEERLVLAADAARLGYWDLDIPTGHLFFSGRMHEVMGLTMPGDRSTLAHFLASIDGNFRDIVSQHVRDALNPSGTGLMDVEYLIHPSDGAPRWMHTRGQALDRDAQGHPQRALGITMDVTERRHNEGQLAQTLKSLQHRQQELLQLSQTINRSPVVAMTWSTRPGWPICHVSDSVSQWGYQRSDLTEHEVTFESLVHPDDLPRVNAEVAARFAAGLDGYDQKYRIRAANGDWLWIEDHTWMDRDDQGQVHHVHGVLTDVSVRHRLELAAAVEREVLERLVKGDALRPLLHTLAVHCEALLPGTLCSILLLNEARRSLHEGAAPSLPKGYREAIEGVLIGPAVGSCGTAAHSGQTVVVSDIASDPLWAHYRELALSHGLQACWSVPIKGTQGRVLGTFALYQARVAVPQPHEIDAVERGAYLAGLAIERDASEQQLRKLSLAVEQSPSSVIISNLNAEIEYANQAFYNITGYSPDEVLGANPRILQSGKTPADTYRALWHTLGEGRAFKGEFVNKRKDGSEYTEAVRISPVHQPDGKVTHYLAIKEDVTRQKAAEKEIHRLAYFDALTGLPNRQLLADRFHQAMSMAERQHEPLALMFIDLDHFKNINDTLGHRAGDDLLVQVSRHLEVLLRAGDTLSRQGGDEFVLVLPRCGPKEASLVAEKLLATGAQTFSVDGHEVAITLSAGIAIYPTDGADFGALSKGADVAMYRAKQAGRNAYRFFTPDMQSRSSRTLMLENHLRLALDRQELTLVYQPQMSLADGHLVGVEALLRWQHPELGLISPVEFIPLAEASGQILSIGEWVLRTAAHQLKTWMNDGLGNLTMAVNLSAVQFRDPGLTRLVDAVLKETGLPPGSLELELTESVAMDDPLGAVVVIDEITALNVSMSIDDFGTGYSSLSYLKRFKVGKLKIDQSFVRDITSDPDDKAIVSAIIGLASNLGLRTIAEGVETPGQLAWLRLQGCDEAQGYFFSRPLTPEAFEAWVRSSGELP